MKDLFSSHSASYAKYRPNYPSELFDFVSSHCQQRENAWDCATGNGQTAIALSRYFTMVYATDLSQRQIEQAVPSGNVHYSVQAAEKVNFANDQFDLVTVSQALHWFDFEKFYAEVNRVGRTGCVVAAWSYSLFTISPDIDDVVYDFYENVIGGYWDPERKYVEEEYKSIPFPFVEIPAPKFEMRFRWNPEQIQGYFNTWSAVQKFIAANSLDPVDELMKKIAKISGSEMEVVFPIHLRMGRIRK